MPEGTAAIAAAIRAALAELDREARVLNFVLYALKPTPGRPPRHPDEAREPQSVR